MLNMLVRSNLTLTVPLTLIDGAEDPENPFACSDVPGSEFNVLLFNYQS